MTAREYWATQVREHLDARGHVFRYVHVRHPGATGLVVHFSAFFGEWGDARANRRAFQGHFHRLRLLGDVASHDWLFLCDEYGADKNGTYYTGERGDFFVERGIGDLIELIMADSGYACSAMVTMGSSMGATAALKFGLMLDVKGIVAVSPHIDLDICAERQGRWQHVAFICPDGDPLAPHNHPHTRQIRTLIDGRTEADPPPRLFMQACRDDAGVYTEQVEPLCTAWRRAGGMVTLDARRKGGHTSEYASRSLLIDAVDRLFDDHPIDVTRYQHARAFRGHSVAAGILRSARPALGRLLRTLRLRPRPGGARGA
ncbi:MAG: Two component regulator three Y domain-containing protein [Solirubrobacteraceae bacterium]